MKTAAMAGIVVRVMISAPGGAGYSPVYRAGMTYAADMARAGVQVLLYQGAYFHAKTVCVDSMIRSIGSANMDIRSFSINYETNLVVYDDRLTRELEVDFPVRPTWRTAWSSRRRNTRRGRVRRGSSIPHYAYVHPTLAGRWLPRTAAFTLRVQLMAAPSWSRAASAWWGCAPCSSPGAAVPQ